MNRSTVTMRRRPWTLGHWLRGILVSLTLGSTQVGAAYALGPAATNFPGKITLQDGKLTARIVEVPPRQVMEKVGRLSGAQVRWLGDCGEEPVSVEFTALPFSEALRRILGEKNFLLFYISTGEGAKLTQIWISSTGKAGGPPMLTPQPVAAGEATPRAEEPDEEAAQALEVVIQTAVSDENLAARLSAIGYLGEHAQEDPRVKEILSQLAHNDSNLQVQEAASEALARLQQ